MHRKVESSLNYDNQEVFWQESALTKEKKKEREDAEDKD